MLDSGVCETLRQGTIFPVGDEGLGSGDELRNSAPASAANSGAVDADLAAVFAAWPTLDESTRRDILAMIRPREA